MIASGMSIAHRSLDHEYCALNIQRMVRKNAAIAAKATTENARRTGERCWGIRHAQSGGGWAYEFILRDTSKTCRVVHDPSPATGGY